MFISENRKNIFTRVHSQKKMKFGFKQLPLNANDGDTFVNTVLETLAFQKVVTECSFVWTYIGVITNF